MKMKSALKALFALFVAVSLTLATAACNKKETEESKTTAGTASTTLTDETTTQPATEEENRVVNGNVSDGQQPIAGATVKIRNTNYQTETDDSGNFSFEITENSSDLPEFRLMISKDGYVSKTFDVTANLFENGVAQVNVTLISSNVELKGTVKDEEGNVIEGVKVVLSNTDYATVTDELGQYSFTIERPLSASIEFSKDYYKNETLTIEDLSNGSDFVNDVTMKSNKVTVSGKVSNYYDGVIAGAKVGIFGTDYEAVSDENGEYTIENALVADEDFVLTVSKEGYLDNTKKYASNNDLELVSDYTHYASMDLYENNKLEGYVTKSSEGIYFRYVVDSFRYEAGQGEEKVQVYINPGKYTDPARLVSEEYPDGGHAVEIALTSNNDIVVFVNYYKGTNFVTSILWGTELIYSTKKLESGQTELNLFVKYSVFGDYCGVDYAINADSIIGLGLNFYSDLTSAHLYNWSTPDMIGADGKETVGHNNPQDWPRLAADGRSLYEGSSNVQYEEAERTISGKLGETVSVVQADLDASTWFTLTDAVEGDYVFDDSKMHAKWELDGKTLKITYTGKSSQVADDNEFWQFITFDNFATKYDIRIKNGWAGVYNWTTSTWESWNAKIGTATYTRDADADTLTITMNIDLTFFEDLGATVSSLQACPIIFGVKTLTYEKFVAQEGVTVAVPQFGYNHKETVTQVDTTNDTWANLGDLFEGDYIFDDSKMHAEWKRVGDLVYITYTGKSSQVADDNEFWQFITFDNFATKYDIRIKNGWAGIYNWATAAWESWNGKIGTATYTRDADADTLTITMTIDLTFFKDLGCDISSANVKVCPIIFGLKTVTYERTLTAEPENYDKKYYVSAVTDANGEYTLVIPASKINVDVLNVLYTKKGYQEQTKQFLRSDFENNAASYSTALIEGKITTTVSGKVTDNSGNAVAGALVSISKDIYALTDENGNYALNAVDNEVAPYKLTVSKDGYYVSVLTVAELVSENQDAVLEAMPEESDAFDFTITSEYQEIGTLSVDNIKVYAKLESDTLFTIKYVFAEGAVTTAPEELLKVYFNFNNSDVIYSVRITNKVWTGIYNENTNAWETWNDKVGNPVIETADGVTTITQTIDMSYFTGLGQDLSVIRVSVAEYTNNNNHGLVLANGKSLSVTNASKFVKVVVAKAE